MTRLPNRTTVEARIEKHLQTVAGGDSALLMIALARLPEIVKTMGHAIGDRVMRDAALRLAQPASIGLLTRAIDSEFAVWLPKAHRAAAIATAFCVLDALGVLTAIGCDHAQGYHLAHPLDANRVETFIREHSWQEPSP